MGDATDFDGLVGDYGGWLFGGRDHGDFHAAICTDAHADTATADTRGYAHTIGGATDRLGEQFLEELHGQRHL